MCLWQCLSLRSSALSILWRCGHEDRYGTLSWCAHLSKDHELPNLRIFPPHHRRRRSRSALCWCRGNKIVEEHLPRTQGTQFSVVQGAKDSQQKTSSRMQKLGVEEERTLQAKPGAWESFSRCDCTTRIDRRFFRDAQNSCRDLSSCCCTDFVSPRSPSATDLSSRM